MKSLSTSHTKSRRAVLAGTSTVVYAALAGCFADDEQSTDDDHSTTQDESDIDTNEETHAQSLDTFLTENGIDVEESRFEADDATLALSYETRGGTEDDLGDEIGVITGGFMNELEDGLDAQRLDATILDGGDLLATWYVDAEWHDELANDEMTPEELTLTVLDTVEPVD